MASILNVDKIRATGSTSDALAIDSSGRVTQPALPAACFHYQGVNLSGSAVVPLNTQSVLQGGMSMSSNAITVPVTGLYRIGWHHLATSSSAYSVFFIRINGVQNSALAHGWATQVQPAGNNSNFSAETITSLSANDTVDFLISSGAIHGNADYNSMFVYLLG